MALAKPVSPVLQRDHPLALGLVLGWTLHETAGGLAHDLSGGGYHGTFTGNWTAGPSGAAAHVDGSTTDISRFSSTAVYPTPNVTTGDFTAAVRFTVSTLGSYTTIIDFADAQTGRTLAMFINEGGIASSLYWAVNSNGTGGVALGQNLVINTLYDLVATRKGTLSSFYLNGKPVSTNSSQTSTAGWSGNGWNKTASLGLNPSTGGAKEPTTYDYFMLWNRALSANEVAQFVSDPFAIVRPRSRWWEVPAAAGAFTNRPGPRMGPALPFGLSIAGAKLLERNPIMRRRELFRWANRGDTNGVRQEGNV